MAIEYFMAYHSYLDSIELLEDAERGKLFTACLTYSKTGQIPEMKGNEKFVFSSIKSQIDRDVEKYQMRCDKNRQNILQRYTTVDDCIQSNTMATKEKEKDKEKDKDKENISSSDKPKKKTVFDHDSKPYQCAIYLDKQICERLESRKPSSEDKLQKWALSFDQTNRIDDKSWDLIEQVLVFSQEDSFWRKNILSGDTFRKQFERLQAKIGR